MSSQTGDFNVLTFPWTLQSGFSYLTVALIASVVALTESSSVSVPVIILTQHNTVWLSFQHHRHPLALVWSHTVHPLHPSRNFCWFFLFLYPWHPMLAATKQTVSRLCYSVSGYFSCIKVSVQNVSSANTWLFGRILVGSSWPQCSCFFCSGFFCGKFFSPPSSRRAPIAIFWRQQTPSLTCGWERRTQYQNRPVMEENRRCERGVERFRQRNYG